MPAHRPEHIKARPTEGEPNFSAIPRGHLLRLRPSHLLLPAASAFVLLTGSLGWAQDFSEFGYRNDPAPVPWTSYAIVIGAILTYFIPSMVAFWRRHPNRWPILGINLLFGGTGLGWIGALIWALHAVHKSETGSDGGESGLNLFVNDVKTIRMEPARSGLGTTTGEPFHDLNPRDDRQDRAHDGQSSSSALMQPTDNAGQALVQLQRLKTLLEAGVITAEEYGRMRAPLLAKVMGE